MGISTILTRFCGFWLEVMLLGLFDFDVIIDCASAHSVHYLLMLVVYRNLYMMQWGLSLAFLVCIREEFRFAGLAW